MKIVPDYFLEKIIPCIETYSHHLDPEIQSTIVYEILEYSRKQKNSEIMPKLEKNLIV